MVRRWLGLLLPFLMLPGCSNPSAADMQALQGEWKSVAIQDIGQFRPGEVIHGNDMRIRFDGSNMSILWGPGFSGTYTIDSTSIPKSIDMLLESPGSEPRNFPGIFEVTGNRLRLCFSRDPNSRPTEFRLIPPARGMIVAFERLPPNATGSTP